MPDHNPGNKLKELILYVAEQSEGDPDFGLTKLYKTLFYSDFRTYARTRRSITGVEYQKFPYGPVPAGGPEAIEAMEAARDLAIARHARYGRVQKQPKALRDADLADFTGKEIATVHEVLAELRGLNASDVRDLSHRFIGWKAALPYEVIPYETVFIEEDPPSDDDERWLSELAATGR
jgi:hypothetical protein